MRTGELRSVAGEGAASKVLLREQPFRILKMLIDRRGKIVTREEIRKKLWPNDTIVNFDHSINVAIGILRRALDDSADKPRYIETLARRGYRLLVTTEVLETSAELAPDDRKVNQPLPTGVDILGKKVSHYRVLEAIGEGGMGVVYRAEDLRLGRRVALKFLPPEVTTDAAILRRFEREAQTASTLNHPNICTIFEIEEQDSQPFIVMELLEGESLNHALDSAPSKSISVGRLLEIALQICDGLQAAHEKGIVHRDIKPANIFLTTAGPVKILDFGVAKLMKSDEIAEVPSEPSSEESLGLKSASSESPRAPVEAGLTATGAAMGTASYMSPEQVRGENLDATTDLFSFGLLLYEAATGRRAFAGESPTVVKNEILHDSLQPAYRANSNLPRALDAVISKALEKDRTRRYQSALEMRQDIERVRKNIRSAPRRRWVALTAACLLIVTILGTWLYWRSRHPISLSRNDTIVLAVTNQTKDPVFDDAVYSTVFFGLQQTPYIHVLQTDKLREALWELHIADDAKRTPEIGRQVCLRTRSKLVIATSISEEGNGFRVRVEGLGCQTGATVAEVEEYAPSRAQVVHVLGVALARLRGKLGEPRRSIASFNKPLDEALSASPEALQLLTEGYKRLLAADLRAGVLALERAIVVDSNLAMAYTAIAGAEDGLGDHSAATAAATKAFSLRDRVTMPVQFQIDDLYYGVATGELEKNYSVLSQWVQLYPDDFIAHANFAECLRRLGKQDHSLTEAREAARLFPSPWSFNDLILTDILTDRLDEAKATIAEADLRKFDNPVMRDLQVWVAFLNQDLTAMQVQWDWAVGKPHTDHTFLFGQGAVEGFYGRFSNYLRFANRAVDLAGKYGESVEIARYDNVFALDEAEVYNFAIAREFASRSLLMTQNANTLPTLALAMARAGNITEAQVIVDKLNREAPLNTVVQGYYLPAIRAAIRLQLHDPAGAIEVLRPALAYDMAYTFSMGGLYPAYIRGQAYLDMGQGQLASVEFQKLLDHPGMAGRDMIGVLSRLQMARAQKMEGNTLAAQTSYENFLALWKDADPNLPIYQQAKAEYGSLHTIKKTPQM
jgi:serine/threonine protein kinase